MSIHGSSTFEFKPCELLTENSEDGRLTLLTPDTEGAEDGETHASSAPLTIPSPSGAFVSFVHIGSE